MRGILILISLFLIGQSVTAQPDYEKGYYQFPIKPGKTSYFAGTMGELRGSHFHAGLDIKTNYETGWPVYAAADGFISRISNQSAGYGYALYLQHPNGHTTVYAHLEKLAPALQRRMRQAQYQQQEAHLNIFPVAEEFYFKKGQIIGYSGNSGYSFAPHLHFEIRDARQRPLNPAYFGFSEISDNVPPRVYELALQPLNKNSSISGKFARQHFAIKGNKNSFYIADTIAATGLIGIEIFAYDRANFTNNKYGINEVEVFVDGTLHYHHQIDRVPFSDSHYISSFINYPVYMATGQRYQRLYQTEANQLPIYPEPSFNGAIKVAAGMGHRVNIRLTDSFGNRSSLSLMIKDDKNAYNSQKAIVPFRLNTMQTFQDDDQLYMAMPLAEEKVAVLHTQFQQFQLLPVWQHDSVQVYSYNLTKETPSYLATATDTLPIHYLGQAKPGVGSSFLLSDSIHIHTRANSFYSPTFLQFSQKKDELYIGPAEALVRNPITINYIPSSVPVEKDKAAIFLLDRKNKPTIYIGGKWLNDSTFQFETKQLGRFTLSTDVKQPAVQPITVSKNRIKLKIIEEESGMNRYEATLNGKWLLVEYDLKNKMLQTVDDDPNLPFKGKFRLKVSDKQGNTSIFERQL